MLKIPVALRGQQDRAGPGLSSSHQVPGLALWHSLSHSVPIGKGLGAHHTQPKHLRGKQQSPAAHRDLFGQCFVSLLISPISPLFPAQLEAELLATEPSQWQQTRGDIMEQPWRWCLAVSWPWHREPGPQSGCLHGCAWPKVNGRKANTDPFSCQHQCPLPGLPTLWVPSHSCMGHSGGARQFCIPCVSPTPFPCKRWELKSRGDGLGLAEHPSHGRTATPRTGNSWLCSQHCPQTVPLQ